jgi:hypothetical protein
MAMLAQHYPDHLYMAGIPIRVQKVLLAGLAGLGRISGKRLPDDSELG